MTTAMRADDTLADRYHVHAYVAHGSVMRKHSVQGQVTFAWVYQNRPGEARYAVVSDWDPNLRARRYLVYDLFDVHRDNKTNRMVVPAPKWTHDDCAAAIMAAVLMYGGS